MKIIIDRFEGAYAVAELPDGSLERLASSLIPGAVEGDVIRIEIDSGETANRRQKIQKLMEDVFE